MNRIPELERALITTQKQLKALERANAKEVIELHRQIATEREVRLEVAKRLTSIQASLDSLSPKEAIDELAALAANESLNSYS